MEDVRELVKGFRGGTDRLELLTNIHKSISVSSSINEAMKKILTMETSTVLVTEELIEILNTYIDNILIYIDMVDKITGVIDERKNLPHTDEGKSMAI